MYCLNTHKVSKLHGTYPAVFPEDRLFVLYRFGCTTGFLAYQSIFYDTLSFIYR